MMTNKHFLSSKLKYIEVSIDDNSLTIKYNNTKEQLLSPAEIIDMYSKSLKDFASFHINELKKIDLKDLYELFSEFNLENRIAADTFKLIKETIEDFIISKTSLSMRVPYNINETIFWDRDDVPYRRHYISGLEDLIVTKMLFSNKWVWYEFEDYLSLVKETVITISESEDATTVYVNTPLYSNRVATINILNPGYSNV